MAFDTTGEIKWEIPEGYYESVAQSNTNAMLHFAGRALVNPAVIAFCGRPMIVTTPEFDEARKSFSDGNIVIASTHRSDWETVIQPSVFERVDLHHARPIAKLDPLYQGRIRRGVMHGLGAFAVDKRSGRTDMQGLLQAQSGVLSQGGIMTVYMEGTRITTNPLEVAPIQTGGIIAAIMNKSLVVPTALAGLSKEKIGTSDDKRTIAKDKPSKFGRDLKLVAAFGDPFTFDEPDFDTSMLGENLRELPKNDRKSVIKYLRESAAVVRLSMQKALDCAYEVRGDGLEDIHSVVA